MFKIDKETLEIKITRGDVGSLGVTASMEDGTNYIFKESDVVRLKVFKRKDADDVELTKDVLVTEETEEVVIDLTSEDTKIGNIINKPVSYWYEVELNPDTQPQTIIGYDDELGEKKFTLYPEGGDE